MVRRIFVGIVSVAMIAVILPTVALPAPTKASPEYVYVLPIFRGADMYADPYYKETVLAYRMNETVTIDVFVRNEYIDLRYFIVEVGIRFDWMREGSYIPSKDVSRLRPYTLLGGGWTIFPIEVQLPDRPGINKFHHIYDVRVTAVWYEEVFCGVWEEEEVVVGGWVDWGLAIYSPEQIQAVELYEKLSQRLGLQPLNVFRSPSPPPTFTTSEATVLVRQASALAMDGLREYEEGEFSKAASTFTAALNLYEKALTSEAELGKALEEAAIKQADAQAEQARAQTEEAKAMADQAKAQAAQATALSAQADALSQQAKALGEQAKAMDKQADALMTLAYGLSAGTILIGIGVIIFAVISSRRTLAR